MVPKRITMLVVTDDFARQCAVYERLGFRGIDVDDLECRGYVAGETGLILQSAALATRCYGGTVAARLEARPVAYVFVDQIDLEALPEAHHILAMVETGYGTREIVIEARGGLMMILVERILSGVEGPAVPAASATNLTPAAGR